MTTDSFPLLCRPSYNLDNYLQRQEAAGMIYVIAHRAHKGRLANALMGAELPHGWQPKRDARTKAGREYLAAERAMWTAITRYDDARLALLKQGA
jgi:hypothetical protein